MLDWPGKVAVDFRTTLLYTEILAELWMRILMDHSSTGRVGLSSPERTILRFLVSFHAFKPCPPRPLPRPTLPKREGDSSEHANPRS